MVILLFYQWESVLLKLFVALVLYLSLVIGSSGTSDGSELEILISIGRELYFREEYGNEINLVLVQ